MFINGEWVDAQGGETFDVTNPATGEKIGEMPDGSAVDAEQAIAAADAAFAAWSSTTAFARADILMRAWQLMNDRADELAHLMTTEQGKPLKAARFEVGYGADFLRWFAEEVFPLVHERDPDTTLTIIGKNPPPDFYQLQEKIATLMVRPRGWHLVEKHVLVDDDPISAALFDFGLFFFHNAYQQRYYMINQYLLLNLLMFYNRGYVIPYHFE